MTESTSSENIEIVKNKVWETKGERFRLFVKKLPPLNGMTDYQYTLNISGLGPIIQLTYPDEPYSIEVFPEEVNFCGHTFEVESVGVIKIDKKEFKYNPYGSRLLFFVNGHLTVVEM